MIEETARVIATEGDYALLQAERKSSCQTCAANKGCGTAVLSKVIGNRFTSFKALNSLDVKVGDEVIVGINEDALLKGSFAVYIIPLLIFLLFALLTDAVGAIWGLEGEVHIILGGFAGLITGLFIIRHLFSRKINETRLKPVILRKIHSLTPHRDTMLAP